MSSNKPSLPPQGVLSPVASNPDAVQALINEYFSYSGSSQMTEEGLWQMFSGCISNSDTPTDATQNANLAFVYRQLLDLIKSLEPYYVNKRLCLPSN